MSCNTQEFPGFTWTPEDPRGPGHAALDRWLRQAMDPDRADYWLGEIDALIYGRGPDARRTFIRQICEYDAPELVELLFPRRPQWFLELLSDTARFNAVSLCAFHGSILSLEALLSLGADPNNRDCPGAWQNFSCHTGGQEILFTCTPWDLARAADQEECCFLLELYGGAPAWELCHIPRELFPTLLPCPNDPRLITILPDCPGDEP